MKTKMIDRWVAVRSVVRWGVYAVVGIMLGLMIRVWF